MSNDTGNIRFDQYEAPGLADAQPAAPVDDNHHQDGTPPTESTLPPLAVQAATATQTEAPAEASPMRVQIHDAVAASQPKPARAAIVTGDRCRGETVADGWIRTTPFTGRHWT